VTLLLIILTALFSSAAYGMEAEDYVTDNLDDMSDMSHQHITQILQDRKGFLWLSSWNGLYRFDGYGFVAFKAMPGDGNNMGSCRFRNIVLDYDVTPLSAVGNIYCLVDDDVFLFDVRTARFVSVGGSQERTARRLFKDNGSRTGGFTDDRGIHWKITSDGFFRSVPRERKWRRVDAVPGTVTRLMYRDRLGRVWIGTKDGRLTVLDSNLRLLGYMGKDGRLHDSDTEFYPVYSICEDSEGAMWFGCKPDGLFRLHGDSIEHIDGLNSWNVYDLKTDRRGRLWVATHVGGISVVSRKDGRYVIEPIAATKGLRIRRLLILDDGTLIATTTTGLLIADNIYRPLDRMCWRMHVREANRAESLSDNATMNVVRDCRGRVFVTTESGGLNLLLTENLHADRLSFRHYGLKNGLGSDVTMACAPLNDSVLLVQCNNMLSLLDTNTSRMENFGKSFWGENLQFSDAEPLLLPGGRLLISLQTGVLAVAASDLYAVDYRPRIALTGLRTAGISSDYVVDYTVDYRDTIVINPSQRDFTLSFSALDFTGNRYIRYATKLDEDSLWSHPTATNSIDFRDIAAGTHTLSIRSTNALGQWTDNVRTVTIVVEPTFFETWYGRMLLMIVVAGLIVLLTYIIIYVRTLEKRRKETLEAYLLLLDQKKEDYSNTPAEPKQHAEQRPEPIVIAPRLSAEDEAFMNKIADFTERNISNSDISINDMAAAAVSRSGLNRKMRQLLGVTPADFLKEARMKRAVKMLKETDVPAADIAYACGFSDPKYFAKCVKASTGMTPRELRDSNP
jgi:AraC-like DNA-binding protein/ligand-binding sensor domain-containing protein